MRTDAASHFGNSARPVQFGALSLNVICSSVRTSMYTAIWPKRVCSVKFTRW